MTTEFLESQVDINNSVHDLLKGHQQRIGNLEARIAELNDTLSEKILPMLLELSSHMGDEGLGSVVRALCNAVNELQEEHDAPASKFTHYLPVAIRRAENEG
jgi:hypothetical protein|tara:strand:- start:310 stop:615 length:306 start_codon:yes stop_codon:yes gene_type:complete